MLTAGITRETSPARCGVSGEAIISFGLHSSADKQNAIAQAYGDFIVFIEDSPELIAVTIFVTGAPPHCQFEFPRTFPARYLIPCVIARLLFRQIPQYRRPSVILLWPPAGITRHCFGQLFKDFFWCIFPQRFAYLLHSLHAKEFTCAIL
jgi:hypothetical protein